MPATTEVTPSVLVISRVAEGLKLSVSMALTVEASVADAAAVLVKVPVAEDRMAATIV